MQMQEYQRRQGRRLLYTIEYEQGSYFIQRDGEIKKSIPDAIILGIAPHEATPELMLGTAIADIETLNGMDE